MGGGFISGDLADYFKEFGIHHQLSTPYTPEQNGRAGKANRTILEGISALLLDCQLPLNFWGFAAETFVYLKNRSPHSKLYRSTPYESWFRRVPDLTNIRIFGFGCYVYIPSEIRRTKGPGHKLLPKATKMVFVGYAENQKGWKCYNPETNSVVVSSNVHFANESMPVNGTKAAIPSLLDTVFPDYSLHKEESIIPIIKKVAMIVQTNSGRKPTIGQITVIPTVIITMKSIFDHKMILNQ
jgi:hypothetical protein